MADQDYPVVPPVIEWDADARMTAIKAMQAALSLMGFELSFRVCDEALYRAVEAYRAAVPMSATDGDNRD